MESALGRGVSKGGKCWFLVESKTFEISIEVVRGKPRGIILEMSNRFSSWIRFGEKSLSYLLEGVEVWCRGESSLRRLKVWEGGRKFRLECRSNEADTLLLCSVRDVEAKKYCLVFPEGKGLVGGWFLLAKKLRALEVSTPALSKVFLGVPISEKEGEEQPSRCLVGRFGDSFESVPLLSSLKGWAFESWFLKGGAVDVLRRESFSCKDGDLKWGVLAVDEETTFFSQLQWARILVRAFGKNMPGSLQVVVGHTCGVVSLWWEAPPWVSQVVPRSVLHKRVGWKVRDKGGGGARVGVSVRGRLAKAPDVDSTTSGPGPRTTGWEELLAVEDVDAGGSILGRLKLTDEALIDEASKPDEALLVPEGASSGSEGSAKGAMGRDPLLCESNSGKGGLSIGSEGGGGGGKMKGGALAVLRSSVDASNCVDGLVWVFTGVYGLVCSRDGEGFWEELGSIKDAKLRALKDILNIWNKEVFGLIETKKGEALRQVVYWDEMEKCSALNLEDCEARKEARKSYKSWVLREEISWRQKSRELCVVGAFQRLYSEEEGWRPCIDGFSFMRLASSEAEGLKIPCSEEEVFAALSDLGNDKVPGPDGFTMALWLFCWDVVKVEIMGLKINLEKSELIPVGWVLDIEDLALELGCKVGGLSSCYLGLPSGTSFKSVVVWDGVEERFRKRLAMWKRQYISKGGRLTLIRITLASMPIYFMPFFYLPRKVRLRLEKIQRDFLWGGGSSCTETASCLGRTWFAWKKGKVVWV
ncbi:hypothetical protein CK203_103273 [Vitis vinifera]|uniref:Uncharacterized protein n=1 Tax=Vitis vinifera TaxID=29760 RepID=A0A438FI51_VITVI|nr:hypothetical protein CK203_103273 [Vitis vinifera]